MSGIPADRVVDAECRQYHIGLRPGEVAQRILLCGDPARADRAAARFDSVSCTVRHREYVTHTGILGGRPLTVMATGMGCDNTEIAVVELLRCVRDPVLIRVGTSGGLREELEIGSLVISTGAVRMESTSLAFVEPGFPAVPHHEVVLALLAAAHRLGVPHRAGLTATAAGFYGAQGRRDEPFLPRDPGLLDRLAAQGVLNLEMETSTLLTLATLGGVRAGAVCTIFANRPRNLFIDPARKAEAEDRALAVAVEALRILDGMEAGRAGGLYRLPI
jgi:uridine phosphorylase